jgi:glutamate-1-semialdehyde 2,1-aminomutase
MATQLRSLDAGLDREVRSFRERTPNSRQLFERARRVMPGGSTRASIFYEPYPVTIVRGSGVEIEDLDGNRYLDFLCNYTSLILGHAQPDVVRAATAAVERGSAVGAPVPGQVELAEELVERLPSVELVRFTNSGTEANIMAVRAARAFTGRDWILKIEGGYHGSSPDLDAAIRDGYSPPGVPGSVATRAVPFNDAVALEQAAESLRENLAAIILEPVMGNAGLILPVEGYLQTVRQIADRVSTLLIFDEVISFRLARGGYQQLAGVTPDLTTLGKIIGGGFPVGAVGGRADVMEVFASKLSHAGTFNGNPVTMAAGGETLRHLDAEAFARLDSLGSHLARGLESAIETSGVRACVTHVGSLVNVHFADPPVVDASSARPVDPAALRVFHLGLMNRGICIAPRGLLIVGLVTGDHDVDRAVEAAAEVFTALAEAGFRRT